MKRHCGIPFVLGRMFCGGDLGRAGQGKAVGVWQIYRHSHLVAAWKEPTAQAVLEDLVGEFILVHDVEAAFEEERHHAGQCVDPGNVETTCFFDYGINEALTNSAAAKILMYHEGAHLGELDSVDVQGDTTTNFAAVRDKDVEISNVLKELMQFTREHTALLHRIVDEGLDAFYFCDLRLAN